MSRTTEAVLRQYEDEDPSEPAVTTPAYYPARQDVHTLPSAQQTLPPVEPVIGVIYKLLSDRPDAASALAAVVKALASPPASVPGPVVPTPEPANLDVPAELAASFAQWREEALSRRGLASKIQSFRSRRSFAKPEAAQECTRTGLDAAAHADSLSVTSTTSSTTTDDLSSLPFSSVSDLPPELISSEFYHAIDSLLQSRVDHTLIRWRRRSLYTAENWTEWQEWSKPSATHRDRMEAGRVFLDATTILTAPNLRSPDSEAAADAWHIYRRHLFILIREALLVGFPWPEILARLLTTFSHPDLGYPRLVNHFTAALDDQALLKYPLLHADVVKREVDCSYAAGSLKYSSDSTTVDWESAISRLPGEDPVSLAIRVTNALLTKYDNPKLTTINVWSTASLATEINERYADCLRNDLADPHRGEHNYHLFRKEWHGARAKHELDRRATPALAFSAKRLAAICIVPNEAAQRDIVAFTASAPAQADPSTTPRLTHPGWTHETGRGSRARRDERRVAAGQWTQPNHRSPNHCQEPPPDIYNLDTLPEQR